MSESAAAHDQDPHAPGSRSLHSAKAWVTLVVVFALGIAADLLTKRAAFHYVADEPVVLRRDEIVGNPGYQIPWHSPVTAIPGDLLDFNLVINRGAVFGLGENRRAAFIVFTLLAAAAGLFVFTRWTTARDRMAHVALGLILAGGIGNLYDRICFGVVRDFLHMLPGWRLPFGWTWPGGNPEVFPWVFNVADVLLLTGMGLLMIHLNRTERRHRKEKAATTSAPSSAPPAARASVNATGSDQQAQATGGDPATPSA